MRAQKWAVLAVLAAVCGVAYLVTPRSVDAHCDTLGGPVIADARTALEKGDVTQALKWVKPDGEAEVKAAFGKALAVRKLGAEARDLADMYFFETLVRVHRAGEGAPYTGIAPAGTKLEPGVAEADAALETGSADPLVKAVASAVEDGIRDRFAKAAEAKKHANESVEAGREYVEAYVTFVHYVERLYADASAPAGHHAAEETEGSAAHEHGQEEKR